MTADAETPDAETPESEASDAEASKTELPETETSETETSETETSETETPDVEAESAPAAPAEPETTSARTPAAVPSHAPSPARLASAGAARQPRATWGRVDDDGTVSVREGESWRVVGQYPDGSPEEALAYFERKFADLAGEVTLLEARSRRGGAPAADLRSTAATLRARVADAAAVGDLESLLSRIDALTETLTEATQAESAAAKEAVDEAVRERTAIVEAAEALAARDPETVQWKQASTEMTELFDRWQSHQQNGPRLPRSLAQQLWRRFRDARATVDRHRREFFASLDQTHKAARDTKTRLVERAEALAPRGEDGIGAYRDLLDEWKNSGRAGKKLDDQLWARFKAAGDALYGARAQREAADTEASKEKIAAKRALLSEAAPIADERDIARARSQLTAIQRRWDEIGRISPRETERTLDDELRKIEQSVRTREEADWKRNNPETKARANDMTRQLTEAIEKLEAELAAAQARGDKRAVQEASDALEARRTWLRAVGG